MASTIIIQLRTEKLGLNLFLAKIKVPNIDTLYNYKEEEELVEYFLYKYSRWNTYRDILGDFKLKPLKETLLSREDSYKAARFLLAIKRLE